EYLDSNGGPGVTPGSVSIIDGSSGFGSPSVNTVGFGAFDAQAAALKASGVRIFGSEAPSNDLEPEYIAISPDGTTAVVTLQENNAVAILNIATATFTSIEPLGLKDFSTLPADFSDRDNGSNGAIGKMTTGKPVFGLYMPDAIASFESGGMTYYIAANEGDDRDDFATTAETARVSSLDLDDTLFPTEADLKLNSNLGRLTVTKIGEDGEPIADPAEQLLALGGRSFSIYDDSGTRIYDSGDIIETAIQSYGLPFFDDTRSDNKGPEPEGVAVGVVNGKTLGFIGLERSNGVMVFDISDPMAPVFVSFLHQAGDVSPEGLTFVPATQSPNNKALLIVTNEVSNSVTVFGFDEITYNLTTSATTNGSITGGGVFVENDTAQLTATPDPGYEFTGWTGDASGTVNPLDVVMDGNKSIGATFGPSSADTDGNGFTDFEEINLDAILKRYNLGDTVAIDLSFLNTAGAEKLAVLGLPKGLKFDPVTKQITGTIAALLGEAPVEIRVLNGKVVVRSIHFNMSVSPNQFVGSYAALSETPGGSPEPNGMIKVLITKPGTFSASLYQSGLAKPRAAKGAFTTNPGDTQLDLTINFPAGKNNNPPAAVVDVTIQAIGTSDLVTGVIDSGASDLRGFRVTKLGRNPEGTRKITMALPNTVDGDGVNVPAGTGTATGAVDAKGIVKLTGFAGDCQKLSYAGDLSQTNQIVFWVQPYKNKVSYFGGIVTIGLLGQPDRGASLDAPLADGVKWLKDADPKEKAYPAGFPVQSLMAETSRWITPPNSNALSDSLGLAFDEINVSYINPLAVANLPTMFRLSSKFKLIRIAPNVAIPWAGGANKANGSFSGTPTLPTGKGVVFGVLLQDASFGTRVGTGLLKVPLPVTPTTPKGSFQTIGIELGQ
ncbi:MAG: choice-of-anchor I family protein, partial [Verrucomicrobiae bacterium]|nr:choice-of-anchor I family protein [Verrucomicrobiae bacterium]